MSFDYHQKAYVCIDVFENKKPVTLVYRSDGDWCFTSSDNNYGNDPDKYRVVGVGHLIDRDPSLAFLENLPNNCEAERKSPKHRWVRRGISEDI